MIKKFFSYLKEIYEWFMEGVLGPAIVWMLMLTGGAVIVYFRMDDDLDIVVAMWLLAVLSFIMGMGIMVFEFFPGDKFITKVESIPKKKKGETTWMRRRLLKSGPS